VGLDKIVVKHVHPTMFDHIHSGKFHDLPNLCFIFTVVTLGLTFLAHGLGIVGALQSHGQTISEKSCAIWAEEDLLLVYLLDIKEPERKRSSFLVMILLAEDPNKFH